MKKKLLFVLILISFSSFSTSAAENTVGLFINEPETMPGYTLFAPISSKHTYLINNEGLLVKTWSSSYNPGLAAYLLAESGNLLRTGNVTNKTFAAGGAGGIVEEYTFEGEKIWSFEYSGPKHLQHHDIERLPNGNTLIIAWDVKTKEEAIAAGRDTSLLNQNSLWPDHIIEVKPTGETSGEIVWQWNAWDHLVQDYDETKANYGSPADSPELVDINFTAGAANGTADCFHTNSIDYNSEFDQILLSIHAFSEIWIIDHSTTTVEAASHSGGNSGKGGDLLYRWGNPKAYGRGTPADRKLFSQHDAKWIEKGLPGEGNILVFNNGLRGPNAKSSILEFKTPVDDKGNYTLKENEIYAPEAPLWVYLGDFFSQNISGVTRLINGNTLICDGPAGTFYEVTPQKEIVWKYINPVIPEGPMTQGDQIPSTQNGQMNSVFRCTRFAPDFSGFDGRVLTAGETIEIYEDDPEPPMVALYKIVDTGQEKFYNNSDVINIPQSGDPFYGQDAQFEGNAPSYRNNGDGTITDEVTGLIWQKKLLDTKLTFAEAVAARDTFSLAGYDDWRLPTIKELYSLIMFYGTDPSGWSGTDVSEITPFINTDYFDFRYGNENDGERIIDAQWATSTEYVDGVLMFGVNFADGRIKGYPKEGIGPTPTPKKYEVFFVRGNPDYGKNLYTDNMDGTVSDSATGLMWTKDDSKEGMNWEAALAWSVQKNNDNYLGYSDWRLPNVKELHSLVDYSRSPSTTSSPAIDPILNSTSITNAEGAVDYPYMWSSTTHANTLKGASGSYVSFGRALGWMQPPGGGEYTLRDVHGAGAQRSDPKAGDPADFPNGHGPQGDVIRIYNYVRLVRDLGTDTGIEESSDIINRLRLYPNPASEYIEISFTSASAASRIDIYNSLGEEVLTFSVLSKNLNHRLNISDLPIGVYTVVVKCGDDIFSQGFVVVR